MSITSHTSTPVTNPGGTIATALFGDVDPARALATASGWPRVRDRLGQALAAVPAGPRDVAARELGGAAARLLGLRIGDVLVAAWRGHRALLAAARVTAENPLATELVQLAAHRITTAHHPYVDVIVNDAKITTVHFDLSLVLDVDTLLGTVRRGRLVALGTARCTVTASLGCEGVDLASRQSVIDPAASVSLGEGIPLTSGA